MWISMMVVRDAKQFDRLSLICIDVLTTMDFIADLYANYSTLRINFLPKLM
jgi:hypothetical protein